MNEKIAKLKSDSSELRSMKEILLLPDSTSEDFERAIELLQRMHFRFDWNPDAMLNTEVSLTKFNIFLDNCSRLALEFEICTMSQRTSQLHLLVLYTRVPPYSAVFVADF